MKKKSEIDIAVLIGRRGAEATLALHGRKTEMEDRRTKRQRTRAARNRRAISED